VLGVSVQIESLPLENKAERIYKLPRNASHTIGKKDQEQAKLSERHPRPPPRQVFSNYTITRLQIPPALLP
jgi:hypothetical protein